jgi:hypothetical protein
MLRFSLFDEHGPAASWPLARAHVLGPGDATFDARIAFDAGTISVRPADRRSTAALALEVDAGRAGTLVLQTCLLQQREEPYRLFEELARQRIKLFLEKSEKWGMLDPGLAPKVFEVFEQARATFVAGLVERDPWKSQQLHRDAVALAVAAAERLALLRAERGLAARFASQGAARALGVRVPIEKAPDLVKSCMSPEFDALLIPTPWQAIEPQQGRFVWDAVDRWVKLAGLSGRVPVIGPLLDLRAGGIPGWVLPCLKDPQRFQERVYSFVREAAIRYGAGGLKPIWHLAAGVNSNEVGAFDPAAMVALVRHAQVALRQVVPGAKFIVEVGDPYGERSPSDNGALGAIPFVRLLITEGVQPEYVGIPVLVGDAQHGTRDFMQFADMLDRFATRKEMPHLLVSALGAPSAAVPGEGGAWCEPWSEKSQAAWAAVAFQVAMSQRKVALVVWDRLRDDAGNGVGAAGMFGPGGVPKAVATKLLLARRKLRQAVAAGGAA